MSPEVVPPETRERLKRLGLYKPQSRTIQDAFFLGVLAAHAPEEGESLSYRALLQRVQKRPLPLTAAEKHAVQVAEMNAGQYLTGLGGRVAGDTGQAALELNPSSIFDYHEHVKDTQAADAYRQEVRTATAQAILERKEVGELKSDLGHATGDWNRNLERVANTELSSAMSQGTARAAVAQSRGKRVRVAVTSAVNCCKYCAKLWLEPNSRVPKIYFLDELEANGTNVGRKASQYLPVLPPVHPSCRCVARIMSDDTEFDEAGRLRVAQKQNLPG